MIYYGTDLLERAQDRLVPGSIYELNAKQVVSLRAKSNGAPLDAGDVMEIRTGGGGGYGDPLEREPARVARDIALGYISLAAARDIYGVVLTAAGSVDASATAALRGTQRSARSAWRAAGVNDASPYTPATGEPSRRIHAYIASVDQDGERVLACDRCGHRYCGYAGDYKAAALMDDSPATVIPSNVDPAQFCDEPIVLRRFACPSCHVQVGADITKENEAVKAEMIFA